jgi:hypothetical protein
LIVLFSYLLERGPPIDMPFKIRCCFSNHIRQPRRVDSGVGGMHCIPQFYTCPLCSPVLRSREMRIVGPRMRSGEGALLFDSVSRLGRPLTVAMREPKRAQINGIDINENHRKRPSRCNDSLQLELSSPLIRGIE